MRLPILYQDADLLVINKPIGIPTHAPDPADPYPGDALRIAQAQTGLPYLGMHQRLDAETSGVLLFAARREANRALAVAFEGGAVRKVYFAVVHGQPQEASGVIDAPIVRDQGDRYRIAAPHDPRGLAARTRYRTIETLAAPPMGATGGTRAHPTLPEPVEGGGRRQAQATRPVLSLLEIMPETGRPHQIRVHLASIGCPVVGDTLYDPQARPAPRLSLHAHQLTVPHPTTGQPVVFTAPLPEILGRLEMLAALTSPPSPPLLRSNTDRRRGGVDGVRPFPPVPAPAFWALGEGGEQRSPGVRALLLDAALTRRAPLANDPATTAYRLIHAAADGAPGVTVDRFGETLVASLYAELSDDDLKPLLGCLVEKTDARSAYLKRRPKQVSHLADEEFADLAPAQPIYGPAVAEVAVQEEGLTYLIRPAAGLSVGLFPDMRETRTRVRAWAAGKRVLNCFAYTCAFGVAALAGSAARVLNLDLSKMVLEWGKANYRANGLAVDDHDFVYGDVFDWLARLARRGDRFDLVILDPPGFSRTKTRRFSAEHDYGELAGLAARVTERGGLLLACCNVAELPRRAFRDRVIAGLVAAGRTAEIVGLYHEPAIDFPAPQERSSYLKIIALRLS